LHKVLITNALANDLKVLTAFVLLLKLTITMKKCFLALVMFFTTILSFGQNVDIELKLTVDKPNPQLYTPVTYTLVATNKGTDIAVNTTIQFIDFSTIPPSTLGFVSNSESINYVYNNWKGIWTINVIGAGQSQTLTLTAS
jgi:uncharacterized repeat protein (TIGR01451 family)